MPEPLAVAPFASWSYEDAIRETKADYDRPTYDIRKSYAEDRDHWRAGKEWIGPGDAVATSGDIYNQFSPEDAIGQALSNVSNAFSAPQFGTTPIKELAPGAEISADMQRLMEEADALLSQWWRKERLTEMVQERQRTTAWAGQAGLRLWIPWRFLMKDGEEVTVRVTTDFDRALSYIKVAAPLPEYARILTDPGTQDRVAVFLEDEIVYEGAENQKKQYAKAELVFLDPDRETDEDADTFVRVVYSNNDKPPTLSKLPLGGHLLFAEMEAVSLLTDPVVRTQRQLNLLTTLITRIGETAAFRERYTMNAKPQGTRITYEEGDELASGAFIERDDEGRLWQVVPTARTLGANTTTELVGLPQLDNLGETKGNQTPGVEIVDPVDPGPYTRAADDTRRRILRMCAQGHLAGASNAEVSGIAYEQARAVFEKDLNKRKISEEGMLRDLLTALLALAEAIVNKPGHFTKRLRVTVDQHANPGPRSPDLVRLDLESYEGGTLSLETTMRRLGVEDVPDETRRVQNSASYVLSILEKAVAVSNGLTPESFEALVAQLNLPKEIVDALEMAEPVAPVVPGVEPVVPGEEDDDDD